MRFARTAGLLLAVLVLVRCGAPVREAPSAKPPVAVEVAIAPAPRAVVRAVVSNRELVGPLPQPHGERVRLLLEVLGPNFCLSPETMRVRDECTAELVGLGASVQPVMREILADPHSTVSEVIGVCTMLDHVREPRQFAQLIVRRLAAPNLLLARDADSGNTDIVRTTLIEYLSDTGDERHAWVLVPLLNDESSVVKSHAAKALAQIGGPRELDALSDWLALQNPNLRFVADLRKARDAREQQLRALPARRTF